MPLILNYRINEGMEISETSNARRRTKIEVVVRDINSSNDRKAIVKFELIDDGRRKIFELFEGERYDVLPRCTLQLPRNPITDRPMGFRTVLLKYFAPRMVEFSKRRMYSQNR